MTGGTTRADRIPFGHLPDGRKVERFTLSSETGLELSALTYGGIIQALRTPDRYGRVADVVLGCDTIEGYLPNPNYLGAIIGRFANRIARGRFTLQGTPYQLATNNGPNHLHGGMRGFDQALWQGESFTESDEVGVRFRYRSAQLEEGYPGDLTVEVSYTLNSRQELVVEYRATTDRPTIVNLTQHSYFNLAGAGRGDVLGHTLAINADHFVPIDATSIPHGNHRPVAGTPFDFRSGKAIGKDLGAGDEQLRHGRGYDHTFVLRRNGPGLVPAARLVDPGSGRVLEVATTEPGLHIFTGNFFDGTLTGNAKVRYGRHAGITLETQHFPDAPNRPDYPSTLLLPGGEFRSMTVFTFGVAHPVRGG